MLDLHATETPSPFSYDEGRALIVYALFYLKLIPGIYTDKSSREADDDLDSYQATILTLLPVNKLDLFNYTYLELFAKAHHIKSKMQERVLLNQIAEIFELDKTLLTDNHPMPSLASLSAFIHCGNLEETHLQGDQAELLKTSISALTHENDTPNDFYVIQGDSSVFEQCPWITSNVAAAFLVEAIDLLEIENYLPHLKLLATLCKHQKLEKRLTDLGIQLEQLPEPFLSKYKEYQQLTSNTNLESTEVQKKDL